MTYRGVVDVDKGVSYCKQTERNIRYRFVSRRLRVTDGKQTC